MQTQTEKYTHDKKNNHTYILYNILIFTFDSSKIEIKKTHHQKLTINKNVHKNMSEIHK